MIEIYNYIEKINFENTFICNEINGNLVSYVNFFGQAMSLAKYIEQNVHEKNLIVVKENSYELVLIYFAMMFTSKRLLVVDPQKGNKVLSEILSNIDRTCIFVDNNLIELAKLYHIIIEMPNLCDDYESDVKSKVLEKLKKRKKGLPYLVTFTSGTSGVTKGVEHSLDNLFLSAIALSKKVGKKGGKYLHVMPMTYMAGILNSLIYPFLIGAQIVLTKRFSVTLARRFWDIVINNDIDLIWLSPAMLMMIEQLDRKNIGEEYTKKKDIIFLIGTAPLTTELRSRFERRYGADLYTSYGLSETLFVSVETKDSRIICNNSVGELLDGVESIFSDEGEILLNVPWMYLRYINEEKDKYYYNNYYKSGDLGVMSDGCLQITGRKKDLIIKGGMNISPALIEKVIDKNSDILENSVFGVKGKSGEEMICCAYVTQGEVDNKKELEIMIKKEVVVSLGKDYLLDYVYNIDKLPRNINGKIDKFRLVEIWESLYDK